MKNLEQRYILHFLLCFHFRERYGFVRKERIMVNMFLYYKKCNIIINK